jgi:hypothetical protein
LRPPASQSALQSKLALYRTWGGVGLSAIGPAGAAMTLILIGVGFGGCSLLRTDGAFAKMDDNEGYRLDWRAPGKRAAADRERPCFRPQRRLRRADQGKQGFQPALGEPRDRRAGLGDAAGPGLFLGRAHLPGFSCELCQRPVGKLVARRRMPERPRPMGNSYLEAVEAGLNPRYPVAKMPRSPQMRGKWASRPEFIPDFP